MSEPFKNNLEHYLRNYRQLVARVDALCAGIEAGHRESIACRQGCDACCRHLTLFAVEGAALSRALDDLPPSRAEHIRHRAHQSSADGPCPLLEEGACLLYPQRPLICRTQGLPLMISGDRGKLIDFCPKNFQGIDSLPAEAVINLEVLNTALVAVNNLFLAETPSPERLTIAEALLL